MLNYLWVGFNLACRHSHDCRVSPSIADGPMPWSTWTVKNLTLRFLTLLALAVLPRLIQKQWISPARFVFWMAHTHNLHMKVSMISTLETNQNGSNKLHDWLDHLMESVLLRVSTLNLYCSSSVVIRQNMVHDIQHSLQILLSRYVHCAVYTEGLSKDKYPF